jgi:hypothetical protein
MARQHARRQRRGARRPQCSDLRSVHHRDTHARLPVEERDQGQVRRQPQGLVALEDIDDLDPNVTAPPVCRHRERESPLSRDLDPHRRDNISAAQRAKAIGELVQQLAGID